MRIVGRCLVLLGCLLSFQVAIEAQHAGRVSETRLCDLPADTTAYHPLVVSADGHRVAYATEVARQWKVLVNQHVGLQSEEKLYDEVRDIVFSPDSQRMVYQARTDQLWRMVIDGGEHPQYQKLGRSIFSEDSMHLAYSAQKNGRWVAVIDGKETPAYDEIRDLYFSPTGVPVYAARFGTQWRMVIGTQQRKLYDEVRELLFSADGKRYAYIARQGKVRFLVVDGVEKAHFADISVFDFSPNGRRFAYAGQEGKQWILVVDDVRVKRYDRVESVIFSPDSNHLASGVTAQWKGYIRFDAKEYGPYRDLSIPQFSADSQHLGFHVTSFPTGIGTVVIDGKEQPIRGGVMSGMPIFSPDSRHVAYQVSVDVGKENNQLNIVVLDGKRQPHEYAVMRWLAFSPDSQHINYAGGDDKVFTPVIDGQELNWHGSMGRIEYSSDSKHQAFAAGLTDRDNTPGAGTNNKCWVVYDGQAGPQYDLIIDPTLSQGAEFELGIRYQYPNPPLYVDFGQAWGRYLLWDDPRYPGIFFDAPEHIHYLAIKDKGVYLVDELFEK